MRKYGALFFVFSIFIFGVAGCDEYSSSPEATEAVQKLSDFREIIQIITVDSSLKSARFSGSPKMKSMAKTNPYMRHVVVYRTKSGDFRIAVVNSDRPASVTGQSIKFK